jgi:hypothetical protein
MNLNLGLNKKLRFWPPGAQCAGKVQKLSQNTLRASEDEFKVEKPVIELIYLHFEQA